MRIWTDEDDFDLPTCVAALGMFDGVHIGHQALIRRAMAIAAEENAPCVVYTFDRHPLGVICPEREPKQLLPLAQKLDKLEKMGVDGVLIKPFTPTFAATPPQTYLKTLSEKLHVRALVAGFNFSFGDHGCGDAEMIRTMASQLSYRAEILSAVEEDGQTVSSTRIRRLIADGDILHAQRLLRLESVR